MLKKKAKDLVLHLRRFIPSEYNTEKKNILKKPTLERSNKGLKYKEKVTIENIELKYAGPLLQIPAKDIKHIFFRY